MKLTSISRATVRTLFLLGACGCNGGDDSKPADEGLAGGGSAEPTPVGSPVDGVEGGATEGTGGSATGGASSGSGEADPCGRSPGACVDSERLMADIKVIAQPRPAGSAHWKLVQDLCADRFEALGLVVERHVYGTEASGINVIGRLPSAAGASGNIIVSAHYDSVSDCGGADDNASGVAGVLEAARVLSAGNHQAPLVFACWDEEETGLWGSGAYVDRAVAEGEDILVALSLEMIGYASSEPDSQTIPSGFASLFPGPVAQIEANSHRGDFIAFVSDASAKATSAALASAADGVSLPRVELELSAELKNAGATSDLRRSDHASFWAEDIPAIMVTDTANFRNPNYHCASGPDAPSDLDADFLRKTVRAVVDGVATRAANSL